MEDIRIDKDGLPRCWNCGSKGFTEKRTFRAKATAVGAGLLTVGVAGGAAALLTKKKLKCQRCGKYNDTGSGKPYDGPAGREYRKEWKAEQKAAQAETTPPSPAGPIPVTPLADQGGSADLVTKLSELAELHRSGSLTDIEFAEAKSALLDGD